MGEHLPCKQGVKSSNLSVSTRRNAQQEEPKKKKKRVRKAVLPAIKEQTMCAF